MNDENHLVSVIIPTYNSEKTIDLCLDSIIEQSYRNTEIIIVDNFSKDGTEKISKKYDITFKQIDCSRTRARNIGSKISHGSFLLHIDSDMELGENVIMECLLKIEDGSDAVIIPEINVGDGFWTKCKQFEKLICMGEYGYEGARFTKKELFLEVGGYDESLEAGEDFDLHFRLINSGAKSGHTHSSINHHIEGLSFSEILKKNIYYSKTLPKYYTKNDVNIKNQKRLYTIIYEKRRLFFKRPIFATGYMILLAFEFIFVVFSTYKK